MKFSHSLGFVVFMMTSVVSANETMTETALGGLLFFDKNLSKNRTQSCATCHDPNNAFRDARDSTVKGAASLGDDGKSLGDRNTPSAAYAMLTPSFTKTKSGTYRGGMFHDGREMDLAGQAGGPPLNPIEMGLSSKAAVIVRLQENKVYKAAFQQLFGERIFEDPEKAYEAMSQSIARFEKTDLFAPFDSKYDRYLRGEYKMTSKEDLGMTLFFSQQFTNCNLCHQLNAVPTANNKEPFSNYEYHNIGVPVNVALREKNGKGKAFVDKGLLDNPAVSDVQQAGKFKTPSLRNVAVTAPYMHNGVFNDLRTVVLFYDKYNSRSKKRQINPETQQQWAAPEVTENLSLKELETGPSLENKRIDALVAFMKTLTDKRYEHLIDQQLKGQE